MARTTVRTAARAGAGRTATALSITRATAKGDSRHRSGLGASSRARRRCSRPPRCTGGALARAKRTPGTRGAMARQGIDPPEKCGFRPQAQRQGPSIGFLDPAPLARAGAGHPRWTGGRSATGMRFRPRGREARSIGQNFRSCASRARRSPKGGSSGPTTGSSTTSRAPSGTGFGAASSAPTTRMSAATTSAFDGSGIADPFNGHIDEFRISHVQHSDDWIATTWNNMSDPGAFAVAGAEEQEGGQPAPPAAAGVVVCLMVSGERAHPLGPLGLGLLHQPGLQRRHRLDPVLRRLLDGPHDPPVARRPLRLPAPLERGACAHGKCATRHPPRDRRGRCRLHHGVGRGVQSQQAVA